MHTKYQIIRYEITFSCNTSVRITKNTFARPCNLLYLYGFPGSLLMAKSMLVKCFPYKVLEICTPEHSTMDMYQFQFSTNNITSTLLFLTLTLPGPSAGVSGSLDSYCSLKPLCSGMGEVVPAHTSPTLLPPSPRTVLSLSSFKVLQCINCRD